MNVFKRLAKGISKTAKGLGKVAPQLAIQALNLGSGGTVGMIANALGISGAEPKDILSHIQKNPEESIELLLEMEKTKQVDLKAKIEDLKDARSMAKVMFKSGDPVIAWFLPFLSILLLGMLAYMFYIVSIPVPEGYVRDQSMMMIVGSLLTSVASMSAFWFSKADKDQNNSHINKD